jgi:hypothetical protein
MADVGVLLSRLAAAALSDRAAPHPCSEAGDADRDSSCETPSVSVRSAIKVASAASRSSDPSPVEGSPWRARTHGRAAQSVSSAKGAASFLAWGSAPGPDAFLRCLALKARFSDTTISLSRAFSAWSQSIQNPGAMPQANNEPAPLALKIRPANATRRAILLGLLIIGLTSCASHQFSSPAEDWQARSGQLLYRNANTTVVGDVLVRFSKAGDFELNFSKGPGVALLTIQQDSSFARVQSGLSRLNWSGPSDRAPEQLRGWLSLRGKLIHAPDQKTIRHRIGQETFIFRF